MDKIGNIVCQNSLLYHEFFNVYSDIDKIDNDLPSLIIGFEYTKSLFPTTINVTAKKAKNFSWTFSSEENWSTNEFDLETFFNYCLEAKLAKVKYFYVDIIQLSLSNKKKILAKIKSLHNIITYIHNNRLVYMLSGNVIFGIDLEICNFVGLNVPKIKTKIINHSLIVLDNEKVIIEYEDMLYRIQNKVKYLPYLYSMKHNER